MLNNRPLQLPLILRRRCRLIPKGHELIHSEHVFHREVSGSKGNCGHLLVTEFLRLRFPMRATGAHLRGRRRALGLLSQQGEVTLEDLATVGVGFECYEEVRGLHVLDEGLAVHFEDDFVESITVAVFAAVKEIR